MERRNKLNFPRIVNGWKTYKKKISKSKQVCFFLLSFQKKYIKFNFPYLYIQNTWFFHKFLLKLFFLYFVSLFVYKFEAMRSDDKGNLFESLENNNLMRFFF